MASEVCFLFFCSFLTEEVPASAQGILRLIHVPTLAQHLPAGRSCLGSQCLRFSVVVFVRVSRFNAEAGLVSVKVSH